MATLSRRSGSAALRSDRHAHALLKVVSVQLPNAPLPQRAHHNAHLRGQRDDGLWGHVALLAGRGAQDTGVAARVGEVELQAVHSVAADKHQGGQQLAKELNGNVPLQRLPAAAAVGGALGRHVRGKLLRVGEHHAVQGAVQGAVEAVVLLRIVHNVLRHSRAHKAGRLLQHVISGTEVRSARDLAAGSPPLVANRHHAGCQEHRCCMSANLVHAASAGRLPRGRARCPKKERCKGAPHVCGRRARGQERRGRVRCAFGCRGGRGEGKHLPAPAAGAAHGDPLAH